MLAEVLSPTQPYVKMVRGVNQDHLFVHDGTTVTYTALGGARGELKEGSDVSERLREAASLYLSLPTRSKEALAGLPLEGRNVTRVQTIYDAVNGYGRRSLFSTRVTVAGALEIPRSNVGRAVPLSIDLLSGQSAHDETILRLLLATETPYIGVLGPRKRTENLLARLAPPPEALERLHGPVGLDIGSESPEEIALAVLAEIQARLNRRPGGSLRDRRLPLHDWPR